MKVKLTMDSKLSWQFHRRSEGSFLLELPTWAGKRDACQFHNHSVKYFAHKGPEESKMLLLSGLHCKCWKELWWNSELWRLPTVPFPFWKQNQVICNSRFCEEIWMKRMLDVSMEENFGNTPGEKEKERRRSFWASTVMIHYRDGWVAWEKLVNFTAFCVLLWACARSVHWATK